MTCGSGVGEPLGGELLDAEEPSQTVVDPGARDDSAWREDRPVQGALAVTGVFLAEIGVTHELLEEGQAMFTHHAHAVSDLSLTDPLVVPGWVV